jgi:hypothetical protein
MKPRWLSALFAMSCKHKRAYSFLKVESAIAQRRCKFSPGGSADHAVTVTSFAVRDVEISLSCRCPNGRFSYPSGYQWNPAYVTLLAVGVGGGVKSHTFHEALTARSASAGDHLPQSEQLELEPLRRTLPGGSAVQLPILPIGVTVE